MSMSTSVNHTSVQLINPEHYEAAENLLDRTKTRLVPMTPCYCPVHDVPMKVKSSVRSYVVPQVVLRVTRKCRCEECHQEDTLTTFTQIDSHCYIARLFPEK